MNALHARDILAWLSAYSIGTALFTAALCLRMVSSNPKRYLSFAAAKVGYSLTVAVVLFRIVLPSSGLTVDGWTVTYSGGLAIAALGFMGVGRTIRREFVAWETRQELAATAAQVDHVILHVEKHPEEADPEGLHGDIEEADTP